MSKMFQKPLIVTLFSIFLVTPVISYSYITKSVNKEDKNYLLNLKFPQATGYSIVDKQVKEKVKVFKTEFIKDINKNADLPVSIPGKNSLRINYEVIYNQPPVISIKLIVSEYFRGAAHPNTNIYTLNFMDNNPIQLSDLFVKDTGYLTFLAKYSRKQLLEKKSFDRKWLWEGTKAVEENYRNWLFGKNGLIIIFDSYQVAAYVDGPQTVNVPLTSLKKMMKPGILRAVWEQK